MTRLAFKVWDACDSEEGARMVPVGTEPDEALEAKDAALVEGERRWAEDDYPDEQTLYVRDLGGVLTRWTVVAEQTVSFTARPAKEGV